MKYQEVFVKRIEYFLDYLIVQNKLKEAESHTLKILKEKANAKVKMVTGVILWL